MQQSPIQLAVVIGSVRAGRFGPVVARWFLDQLSAHEGFTVDVIDLAELSLPADLAGGGDAAAFCSRVAAAEAFVIVTPEYNHGYPGPLKTAIDTAVTEWQAKPVGFVSYGGMAGGLRSVEQLRPIFAELHAVTVRNAVSFHWAHDQFDDNGQLRDPSRANGTAAALLEQLSWWAHSLREARESRQYRA